ncbi:uncharacterized protein BROUX77_003879 [Berkeleyomyces rouxiae]|uniref:uncharacterized protein n=1 Tax=Berkeleyomyces rouxiae TaxID=2035830 RepID=UPI003B80CC07
MPSSLGAGGGGSNSRGLRSSASHTRTRFPLPLDDSDNDVPFMPTPSTMSHTRTRMPIDLDSDDESLPPTVLNGSYLDDATSSLSQRRSRRGTTDARDRDRELEQARRREAEKRERSRSRHRSRSRERLRGSDRHEHERERESGRERGAHSSMAASAVPYPEQVEMPIGGSYDYYENNATPYPPQSQAQYPQEPLVPQLYQASNYRQRASPAPEREYRSSRHRDPLVESSALNARNELDYQPDKYSRGRQSEPSAPLLPPRPGSRVARSTSRHRESSRRRESSCLRESSRHRERSRHKESSRRREPSSHRESSRHRDISRPRRRSTSKNLPATYESHLTYGEEEAIASSDDDQVDHKKHSRRPSASHPEDEERRRRRSSISGSRHDAKRSQSMLLGDDLGAHRRTSRSHSRSRSEVQPPIDKMSLLTIGSSGGLHRHTRRHSSVSLVAPSPMLEPYRGTWQESSPMPSPILRNGPRQSDSQIPDLTLNDSAPEQPRRARFHDPTGYTVQIANAIKNEDRAPDTAPLIEILPGLTSDQVVELRREYRKMVTVGPDRRGVNVAKHIKIRLKDCEPNLAKACYVVALGPWAAEAYWANFWYHGDKTRHELLIESLMGRTNKEIRQIKYSFRDKRYDNSLLRCMKAELKENKFKKAIIMVLEEERMEDTDENGVPLPIAFDLIDKDVKSLRKSILSPSGGETSMLKVILRRTDTHLSIVLSEYEQSFKSNFARDALKKCGNLVGEVIAHVLNGIINKPVRDAILLHHAITSSRDPVRNELLTSRLVRFHWDGVHMEEIKRQFLARYHVELSEALRDRVPGEFGRFCRELCISRMPNSIVTIPRVSDLQRQHSEIEAARKEVERDRHDM